MVSGSEAPTPDYENVVEADFVAHRREIAIESSPFGPVRKYGEAILKEATGEDAPTPTPTAPLTRHYYRRTELSNLSYALERTDLSDPDKPFIDF